MNSPILLAAAAVVSAASAFAVIQITNRDHEPAPPTADATVLTGRLEALQKLHEETTQALRALAQRLDTAETSGGRTEVAAVTDEQVQRALEAYFARNEDQAERAPAVRAAREAAAEAPPLSVDQALAELTGGTLSRDQRQALWTRAAAANVLDELVQAFEARVQANPNAPQAHAELGNAYLQKLFTVGNGPEQGTWAIKADRSFDKALDIDPNHWEARFSKATSLAFWPPIFGKGAEATKHFEVLIGQQEASGVKKAEYAQSYVFLGNLHDQRGDKDKAKEVWRRGSALYPDSVELSSKSK